MAITRLCLIAGCDKPARRATWCGAHYERWRRYGDPLGGGTYKGQPLRFLQEVVLPYEGDDCLIWPFNRHDRGYAMIWDNGKPARVSRIVCEHRHGPPPFDGAHAAHSCGKGHLSCVSGNHLKWSTVSGNQMDRVAHDTHSRGERHHNHIVSEDGARTIKMLRGVVPQSALAERFGLSKWQVSKIQRGVAWAWLT